MTTSQWARSVCISVCCGLSFAVIPAAAQTVTPVPTRPDAQGVVPIYQVSVVGRTVTAVNFHVLGGDTTLTMQGTNLLPAATGKASVKIGRGANTIHLTVDHVNPAQRFGPEYLTYVLWAISPDGRAKNLGEVQLRGQSATLDATTTLNNFALMVTAEPYFAVSRPSDLVVMEAHVKPGTVGARAEVQAKTELLHRGQYRLHVNPSQVTLIPQSPKVPLDLYEAQNAIRIADWAGADEYAANTYKKAQAQLVQAQSYEARGVDKGPVATVARQAVETAEDARLLSLERQRQNAMAASKAAIQQRASAASAQAQAEADAAQQQAANARAAARSARARAAQAQAARQQAENQAQQARDQLRAQLNAVMATRETARGLIMSMPDVLFAVDKAMLRSDAKLKLAKTAGILMAHPGLRIEVNGYTDSTGTADYNQQLSEQRAAAVAAFLMSQGVNRDAVSSHGFGEEDPVGPNATPAGRQQNRRVEIVVSGGGITTPDAE